MKFCDQVIDLFIDNNREYLNNELKNYEQQDHDKIVFHHFYYMMAKCYFYIQANGFPDEDVDWIAIIEPYNYFY